MITLPGVVLRYVRCAEVPAPGPWLAQAELAELAGWQAPQRRAEFLAGRLAAKQVIWQLAGRQGLELSAIEIRSQDAGGQGRRPAVQVAGQPAPWRLSIAHTQRGALAAASLRPHTAVGVDLVPVDWDCRSVVRFWFTPAERAWLADGPGFGAAGVWAAKEAAYKAAGGGEPFRPGQIEIRPLPSGRLAACPRGAQHWPALQIHIEALDGHVAAVALATAERTAQGGGKDHD